MSVTYTVLPIDIKIRWLAAIAFHPQTKTIFIITVLMLSCDPKLSYSNKMRYLSVHDMAANLGVELTTDDAKALSYALALLTAKRELRTEKTRHNRSTVNPRYNPEEPATSSNRPKNYQAYDVLAFDPSLAYEFEQMCIILGIVE